MPLTSKTRSAALRTLIALGLALATPTACAAFGAQGQSAVARGKYYSSGDPRYDEFFITLYKLQVQMGEVPRVPESELGNLQRALGVPPGTSAVDLAARLRAEAVKLQHAGVHLRLDTQPSPPASEPGAVKVSLHSTVRAEDSATAELLRCVEESATHLSTSVAQATQTEVALGKVELDALTLESDIERTFSPSSFSRRAEVRKNLSDARKLIPLMRARSVAVRSASEQLLTTLVQALNTDDGSLGGAANGSPPVDGHAAGSALASRRATPPKPHTASAPSASRPRHAAKPATEGRVKAAPLSRAAPPARDFEP